MAQYFLDAERDTRTFGEQAARLLRDLNRPRLAGFVEQYLQDAMRYFSSYPFFFTEVDNTDEKTWAASTNYPLGSTIRFTSGGDTYVAVALNSGKSGTTQPAFTTTIFQVPSSGFAPPPSGTAGTTDDNEVRWATVENITQANREAQYWTQLSTVYRENVYTPPIDYASPVLVEVTFSSIRYKLDQVTYERLRELDALRPAPATTFPTLWAWYQQKIYLWPYPTQILPLTISYRTAPPIAREATDSNFWTTKAEALIRAYARWRINTEILRDPEAAALDERAWKEELRRLQAQAVIQNQSGGISPTEW
jgi:hypothetical protein